MAVSTEPPGTPIWLHPLAELVAAQQSSPRGLSPEEAARRLQTFGPNQLRPEPPHRLVGEFLRRFRNPLVIILLAASLVSAATGDVHGAVIIGVIVLISVTLDFVQEHRARQAAEQLRQTVAVRTTVFRGGRLVNLLPRELVPGDVIRLTPGDLVPADGRLIKARDFFVNQALLTGEPFPVEKRPDDLTAPTDLAGATNAVFMGTAVISGSADVLIVRTGAASELGRLSEQLQRAPPPTAFERGLRDFGMLIMRLTVLLVLFTVLVNLFAQRPLIESFLFAVALAVGLTPELLPMIHSVTLARGALRLAAAKVIVKRLTAIEDLGGMDVLCTDKTGTLTEARIRLERHVDANGQPSERVLQLAFLNSAFESGLTSPLDEAILAHREIDVRDWRKIDEVPFDFERRRVSVLVDDGHQRLLVVKGAPEDVLQRCRQVETTDGHQALDAGWEQTCQRLFDQLSSAGFRLLGIAWRQVAPDHDHAGMDDETSLIFAGYAAFFDPPKITAARAITDLQADGVTIKIITGDNELVTRHLCEQLGLAVDSALTGSEAAVMDDWALAARVEATTLFCRMTPIQKERIIRALKHRGRVVGYLGDGINDAPSLHAADVGISVDEATDVAKAAADLILLENDLGVLHRGVREGRRTFGNVMKYVQMATSSNFGNMFSMAGGVILLPFLPMLPLQILLNNLIYDLSEISIPLDRVDEEDLAAPRRWDVGFIRRFMLTLGPVSSVFDFATFAALLSLLQATPEQFRTGWFIESMATQILVIFIIRSRRSPLRSKPSPWLIVTSLLCLGAAVVLPFSPLGPHFGFVPLPLHYLPVLAALVVTYLIAAHIAKRLIVGHVPSGRRRPGPTRPRPPPTDCSLQCRDPSDGWRL